MMCWQVHLLVGPESISTNEDHVSGNVLRLKKGRLRWWWKILWVRWDARCDHLDLPCCGL